jgi:hypothetical protein
VPIEFDRQVIKIQIIAPGSHYLFVKYLKAFQAPSPGGGLSLDLRLSESLSGYFQTEAVRHRLGDQHCKNQGSQYHAGIPGSWFSNLIHFTS